MANFAQSLPRIGTVVYLGLLFILGSLIFQVTKQVVVKAKVAYEHPDISGESYVKALVFLKENSTADAVVLSEWTQGHQIVAHTNRGVVATSKVYPSEAGIVAKRFRDIARFFYATSSAEVHDVLTTYHVTHVFVRKEGYDTYICTYIGRCAMRNPFIQRIIRGDSLPYLMPIYETDWYTILRVTPNEANPATQYAGFTFSYDYFFSQRDVLERNQNTNTGTATGGIVPHHYPYTNAFFPELFTYVKRENPQTIILIGPDHGNKGKAGVTLSRRVWITPFGQLSPNTTIIDHLLKSKSALLDEDIHRSEWSVKTLIPYIKATIPQATIVPILVRSDVSVQEGKRLGDELLRLFSANTFILLSDDFAHRLSTKETEEVDATSRQAIDVMDIDRANDLNQDAKAGLATFLTIMKGSGARSVFLGYDTSERLHSKDPQRYPTYPYIVSYFSYVFQKP